MLVIRPDLEPIPGYRLIQRLGRGGCGEVWKAEAPGGVFKAIKFVFGDLDGIAHDSNAAEQEQKSLQRVKNIRHPFILTTERFEVVEGQLVIVMELADRNLAERFEEYAAQGLPGIPRDELLRYMEETAEALDLMNSQYQIQHMDVKPQNIFLVQNHVKVGDFGLAKNLDGTRAALTGGMTPIYAPPETFDGWVSRQSDQYSLAIVYQEMLTGKRPFNGTNTRQLIMQHLTAQPDLSSLSPLDRGPVDRALTKIPENRYPNCLQFVRALRGVDNGAAPAVRGSGYAKRPIRENERQTQVVRRPAPAVLPGGRSPPPANPAPRAPQTSGSQTRQTQAHRPRQGVLFPVLVVGVGAAGLAVVQHYRRLLLDRYRCATLPHVRCLYIDGDPAAVEAAMGEGPPELRLTADEVLVADLPARELDGGGPAPTGSDTQVGGETMSPPEHLLTGRWVRSMPDPAHARGLPELLEKARAAIKHITAIETLADAAWKTRQEVRSKSPRVYLACDIGDSFGAAALIDLAYSLKNELRLLAMNPDYLIGLLSLPVGENPEAIEHSRSALNELQYFDRPDTLYEVRLDPKGKSISDREPPFGRCTFFDDEATHARAANLLFAETTSGAGLAIQSIRAATAGRHYSAVGLRRVLWPRDLVVSGCARRLAHETLVSWAAPNILGMSDLANGIVQQFWRERRLDLALVRTGIEYGASQRLRSPLDALLEDRLHSLAIGSSKEGTDVLSAEIALNQLAEWLSETRNEQSNVAGRVGAAFTERGLELAGDIDLKLAPLVASLLEKPGQRVAAAREALQILETRLKQELAQVERDAMALSVEVQTAYNSVRELLNVPIQAGKSMYRKPMVAPDFTGRVTAWAQARIRQLRDNTAVDIYCRLLAAIPDFVREIDTLAERLDALSNLLDASPDAGLPDDGVCEYLYPFGAETADDAITQLLHAFGDGGRHEFDDIVQSKLRATGKGVIQLGVRPEWASRLSELLVGEAERFVESKTNRMSVAQALYKHYPDSADLASYLKDLVKAAEAMSIAHSHPVTFIGVPDDTAGQQLGDLLRKLLNDSPVMLFPSSDDLAIIRLSAGVSIDAVRDRLDCRISAGVLA